MSNEFENKNDGGEANQNPYYQDYGDPSQGSGEQNPYQAGDQNAGGQQDYSNPYQGGQQDYSNPYQSGQQNYSSAGNAQYGSYNGYNGGMNTPYNNGNVPLDKKGRPMKNNFGMKLAFSILEMILGGNFISLICGIVACVFTCKANTSYKERKWEEFKSHARLSNIFLWIGLGVGAVIYVILIIVIAVWGFSVLPFVAAHEVSSGSGIYYDEDGDDYNYYDDNDDDSYGYDDSDDEDEDSEDWNSWDSSDDEDDTTDTVTSSVSAGSGYTDPTVILNGSTITFPMSYADFTAQTGLSIDADDAATVISADGYDNYDIASAYDADGNEVCNIWLYNMSGSDLAMADCYVAGVIVYNDDYSVTPDIMIQNGITFSSTQDEVREALGVPGNTYSDTYSDGSLYESWDWEYADPNASYFDEIEIEFTDGVISKIEVDNATLSSAQ